MKINEFTCINPVSAWVSC